MGSRGPTIHEVDFCAQVASAVNVLVSGNPAAFGPIHEARVEGYGTGRGRSRRKDLRFRDSSGRLVLCGEVKLPGTHEGRSAFADKLMQDAFNKADNANVQFFFTWNVNEFALFDRGLWDRPLLDRRVRVWRLPRPMGSAEDVAREENLAFVKTQFLPDLVKDLAARIEKWRTLHPEDGQRDSNRPPEGYKAPKLWAEAAEK